MKRTAPTARRYSLSRARWRAATLECEARSGCRFDCCPDLTRGRSSAWWTTFTTACHGTNRIPSSSWIPDRRCLPCRTCPKRMRETAALGTLTYAVRVNADPAGLVPDVRAVLRGLDRSAALDGAMPLRDIAWARMARPRFYAVWSGLFALLAAVLGNRRRVRHRGVCDGAADQGNRHTDRSRGAAFGGDAPRAFPRDRIGGCRRGRGPLCGVSAVAIPPRHALWSDTR